MNIEDFYSADERRRRSAELELGTDWHDAAGNRYELSWVEDTGELYTMLEINGQLPYTSPFGDMEPLHVAVALDSLQVLLIGAIADRATLDTVLEGWEEAMGESDSVSWIVGRLAAHGISAPSPDEHPPTAPYGR